MTEHELPKLHINEDYVRRAIGEHFAESDTVTSRRVIATEGTRLPNGMLLAEDSLICEDDYLPVMFVSLERSGALIDSTTVGSATGMQRDPETKAISFEITVPAHVGLDHYDFSAYADNLVIEHANDGDKIVWGLLRAIYLLPIPGIPKGLFKDA